MSIVLQYVAQIDFISMQIVTGEAQLLGYYKSALHIHTEYADFTTPIDYLHRYL